MATKLISFIFSMTAVFITSAQASSGNPINKLISSEIERLEKVLIEDPLDTKSRLALARTYKASTGMSNNAEEQYKLLTESEDASPDFIFEYAEFLRSEAEFVEAKVQYLRYAKHNPEVGSYFAEACDYALSQLGTAKNCELEPLNDGENIVVSYKDEVITDSKAFQNSIIKEAIPSQPTAPTLTPKSSLNNHHLNEVLDNSTIEYTNISFNEEGSLVAFSEKSLLYQDQNKISRTNREIFFAMVDPSGQWTSVTAFPFNNPSYSVCYPALANNGKTLYFSSNMAGGYGGYDLYSSQKTENSWSAPINLGALINSPGNEVSPYYKNGDLFYASDWHKGFGGFDIFRTSQYGIVWTDIENLGACVNSSHDDYNFVLDKNNDGYFNSNREGSETNNGIFKTSKLVLKSNIPSLRAITNDEVSLKSPLMIETLENIGSIKNQDIVQTVDDPAIGFLSKEEQANKLYFVQIAAISNYGSAAEARLKNYTKYGNVYKSIEGNVTKIRIGGYSNLNEALSLMKTLKKNGFKDVFVVADIPTEGRCVLVHKMAGDFAQSGTPVQEEGKLKIRVSEFKAPDWFDSSKISDLGKIEHWTKNGWTIIVLGSYNSPNEAISILDKVKARGFNEAYIVVEENGRLYRQN